MKPTGFSKDQLPGFLHELHMLTILLSQIQLLSFFHPKPELYIWGLCRVSHLILVWIAAIEEKKLRCSANSRTSWTLEPPKDLRPQIQVKNKKRNLFLLILKARSHHVPGWFLMG